VIAVSNREGCIVVANRQTETLFGYTRDNSSDSVEMLLPEEAWRHAEHRAILAASRMCA
jgi:PAS domain-containing protein